MLIDGAVFFVTAILPYLAIIVLVDGLLYRLYKWMRKPRAPTIFTIYPADRSLSGAFPKLLGDIIFFPRLLREEKALWVGAWLFHLSLMMAVVSHYKVFFNQMWFWEKLSVTPTTFQTVSRIFDGATGTVMVASLLFLLGRRFLRFLRELSDPEDYLVLLNILAISISGIYIRFYTSVNLLEMRRYFASLASFSPTNAPNEPIFLVHYLLVVILMFYFPFGKMAHTVGAGITNILIRLRRD